MAERRLYINQTRNVETPDEIMSRLVGYAQRARLEFPYYVAAVGANGGFFVVKFTPHSDNPGDGLDHEFLAEHMEFLAEHLEGKGIQLPINMMLTDSTGEAVVLESVEPSEEGPESFEGPEPFWPDSLPSD